MQNELLTKGNLLIAEPSLFEENIFNRAVILLTENNSTGCVGFIINKPSAFTLNDLIPEIDALYTVFIGGPVETDNLYFIHTVPHLIPNSIEIENGIYWGGDFEKVVLLIKTNLLQKNQIRFFLGYSGWAVNQLETEIRRKSWITSPNIHQTRLLSISTKNIWKEKIEAQGGEYLLFSNAPENPNFN